MGARIEGAGTSIIRVEGVRRLHGAAFRVMPDRMEAGTFALSALITGGQVRMDGAVSPYLGALPIKMREPGTQVRHPRGVRGHVALASEGTDIQTYPYPASPRSPGPLSHRLPSRRHSSN
jgi:UDP-N-acetylglucosamine 1-carboxyvinyltransferase